MLNAQVQRVVKDLATRYNIPFSRLAAVVDTESAGKVFAIVHGKSMPLIRIEGHYFWKYLPSHQREVARQKGLAHPTAGVIKNPNRQQDRYDMLDRMRAINEDAALMSISIGLGQVMGAHWQKLGYPSVKAMFETAKAGADGQMELMMRYIDRFGLIDELQRGDMPGFFRGYNGPKWKEWGYDTAYYKNLKQYGDHSDVPLTGEVKVLSMGMVGEQVRRLQTDLNKLGHNVKIDGDFGPMTKNAVISFQKEILLKPDGIAGPLTLDAINTRLSETGNFDNVPDNRSIAQRIVDAIMALLQAFGVMKK